MKHLLDSLSQVFGKKLFHESVLAADVCEDRQQFIMKQGHSKMVIGDVAQIPEGTAHNLRTGKQEPIPTSDLLFSGPSCVFLSRQRRDAGEYTGCRLESLLFLSKAGSCLQFVLYIVLEGSFEGN